MRDLAVYCMALLSLIFLSGHASGNSAKPIDRIVTIPVKNIKAVETGNDVVFMSDNGRFVIRGQLYDVWEKKTLDTIEEIQYSTDHINLAVMGIKPELLNTMTIGTGTQEIVIYVDPQCSYCHELVKQAQVLSGQYTFRFVVVPALGDESNKQARALFCAEDKINSVEKFLTGRLLTLKQTADCDTAQYDQTLITAQLLGVNGVPFLISPDGRYMQGMPKNLVAWAEAYTEETQ